MIEPDLDLAISQGSSVMDASVENPAGRLRLYIARSTPNSARAEQNLRAALDSLDGAGRGLELEIVDVFIHPKRAITDGVIVTPTLIAMRGNARMTMMGDLTDAAKLKTLLRDLTAP